MAGSRCIHGGALSREPFVQRVPGLRLDLVNDFGLPGHEAKRLSGPVYGLVFPRLNLLLQLVEQRSAIGQRQADCAVLRGR